MKKFQRRTRNVAVEWRPPRSDWWSSPLSPDDGNLMQRWHKQYQRFGRRYETITLEGPSVDEDYRSWERGYRQDLRRDTSALRGPRNLTNRRIPTYNFSPSSDQETSPDHQVLDIDDFLGRSRTPQLPSDGSGNSSDEATGASESAVLEEKETRPRYTAAEKGKWREGEPPPSGIGPSALKPAVPKDPWSLAPGMPAQGLRVPPRSHYPRAIAKMSPANQLKQFRQNMGFAAELPLDGLGVVCDRTSMPRPPLPRSKYPSSSAMERTQSPRGFPGLSSQADSVMMERTQSQRGLSGPSSRSGSVMMERTQSQAGVPGPSPPAGSVMMERTKSQARVPDPNSQEYVDMVAESNRRLEELSPYTLDDKIPDTPMPDVEEGTDDKKPPPLPSLSPLASLPPTPRNPFTHGGGYVPPLGPPMPYHAPVLRAKRDASKISGGCTPGPSRHLQASKPTAPPMTVATMSEHGQERGIS